MKRKDKSGQAKKTTQPVPKTPDSQSLPATIPNQPHRFDYLAAHDPSFVATWQEMRQAGRAGEEAAKKSVETFMKSLGKEVVTKGAYSLFLKAKRGENKPLSELGRSEIALGAVTMGIKAPFRIAGSIERLPLGSWRLSFQFEMESPFFSKDNRALHPFENNLSSDWLTRCPMLRPSGWKGMIRNAALHVCKDTLEVDALFGAALGEDKDDTERAHVAAQGLDESTGRRSRILFDPTFFSAARGPAVMKTEMLTPLSRGIKDPATFKKPTPGPVRFQMTTSGTLGQFGALYVPFDLFDPQPFSVDKVLKQSKKDLDLLLDALDVLFCELGIGAKRSSGYGTVKKQIRSVTFHVIGKAENGTFICRNVPMIIEAAIDEAKKKIEELWQTIT